LTSEPSEYLAKREELRLAEIELMRQRERVADLRRHLPQGAPIQNYSFEEGPRELSAGDAPVRTTRLANSSPSPIARSSSITSCMESDRPSLAPCAPPGLMALTALHITSLKISILQSSPLLISPLCAPTRARAAGTSCAFSAAATAPSSTTWAAKTEKASRLHHFRFHPRRRRHAAPFLHRASPDGPEIPERGIDLLAPIWHFMDLTPQGRGNWYANLDYGTKVQGRLDVGNLLGAWSIILQHC
jgi:hypothetical protein